MNTSSGHGLRLVVIGPHFEPDTAPTGDMLTGIVAELAAAGCEVHVITSMPWYRSHALEPGWGGRWWRVERRPWGTITRVHPFPGRDKSNLVRRALGFMAFSILVGIRGLIVAGPWRRVDAVIAMSPPLTLGPTGWLVARARRGRLVLNIQDIFPDAAINTGAITGPRVIAAARSFERLVYRSSDVVTVLSDDMAANIRAKVSPARAERVVVIPNFVDTAAIVPADPQTPYRAALGIGDAVVVMYAGNVGFSQSLELLVELARRRADLAVVINGEGAARERLRAMASGLANVHFVDYQPASRLAEVLASADVLVVPLRAGLAQVSVPSKVYAALAAGRPVVAAIDADTEIPRVLAAAGAGVAVDPDDTEAFVAAVAALADDPERRATMGRAGRRWAEANVSVRSVGARYLDLCRLDLCRLDQ